jgi:tol-pal system protein YbgF
MTYLNDQIQSLNKRVATFQQTIESQLGKRLDTKLEGIYNSQAEMRVEIDGMKERVGSLSGRVEDNEHIIKRTVERDLGEQDTVQSGLVNLSQKVTELEAMVKHQHKYLGLEPLVLKDRQSPSDSVTTEEKVDLTPDPKEPQSKELEQYNAALASFKNGNYEKAMGGFRMFLERYTKSDRADNAHFWIGECHMALKQYEQAILAYQEVIKKYPKGNKVPNAMLRQAMAFLEIKDRTSTRLLLNRVIKKYPHSNEAKIAKSTLENLR